MAVFLIGVVIVLVVFILGLLLAWFFRAMDKTVAINQERIDAQDRAYNPALTMGYEVKVNASPEEQLREARRIAAKQAAALPRGANNRIGRAGESNLRTAGQAVKSDPMTAVKIAEFHGWDGAAAGIPAGGVPAAPATAAAVAAAPAGGGKIELVPGKDYPVIEITDQMTPAEKRTARIANSKAKSAAMKAAKAAGVPAAAAPVAAPAAGAAAAPAPALVGIEPPKLIEITDDMAPEDLRKARIANSKATSAFNKALKTAGIDPKTVQVDDAGNVTFEGGAAPVAAAPAPAPAAPAAAPTAASAPAPASGGKVDLAALGIAPPELIEITDDMAPDDVRAARIANSKARSAFNKALKAAGVDPSTVEL